MDIIGPHELAEIGYNCDYDTIMAFRCTSKEYNKFFSDPRFIILTRAQERSLQILYQEYLDFCNGGGKNPITFASGTGTGKTLIILILLARIMKERPGTVCSIICPNSLVVNWINEHKKFSEKWNFPKLFHININKRVYARDDDIPYPIDSIWLVNRSLMPSGGNYALYSAEIFVHDEGSIGIGDLCRNYGCIGDMQNRSNHPYLSRYGFHVNVNATPKNKINLVKGVAKDQDLGDIPDIDIHIKILEDKYNFLPGSSDRLENFIKDKCVNSTGVALIVIQVGSNGRHFPTSTKYHCQGNNRISSNRKMFYATAGNMEKIYAEKNCVVIGLSSILGIGHNLNPSEIHYIFDDRVKFSYRWAIQTIGRAMRPSTKKKLIPVNIHITYDANDDRRYDISEFNRKNLNLDRIKFVLEFAAFHDFSIIESRFDEWYLGIDRKLLADAESRKIVFGKIAEFSKQDSEELFSKNDIPDKLKVWKYSYPSRYIPVLINYEMLGKVSTRYGYALNCPCYTIPKIKKMCAELGVSDEYKKKRNKGDLIEFVYRFLNNN